MRKVVYGAAVSLDGYLARTDGSVDWLLFSDEAQQLIAESWKRFDTMLMGRRTFEFAQAHGGADNSGDSGMPTYVFSRTLQLNETQNLKQVRDNAVDVVQNLKQQSGQEICLMGGGDLAKSLIDAQLVDEIGLNIHPILLGSGIPMFPADFPTTRLQLIESRTLQNQCIFARYQVNK